MTSHTSNTAASYAPSQPLAPASMTATIALAVLGIFVAYFPVYTVSGSLNTIAAATGASTAQLQWISTAYVIPMAAAVLSAGVYGDIYGRRLLFSIGTTLTALGAGIAALASLFGNYAMPVLLAGQAFAGLGGGILLPTTLALIAVAVPNPRRRSRYIAMWATGTAASLALGPIMSGLILSFAGWGWIFVPTLTLAVIAAGIAHVKLPESKSPEGRSLDIPGQAITWIAIITLTLGVIEGGARGWMSAPAIIGLSTAAIAVVAFITVERRTAAPLMDLRLFKIPSFGAANFGALTALFSIVGVVFLVSLYLGATQQLSALEIGVRIIFVPGISAVVNPIVGRLLGHIKAIHILAAGLLVGAIGSFAISGIHANTGYLDLIWRLAIFGVAHAVMLTAASVSAINAVPPAFAGMAAATNTAFRQLGGALGPAVLGTIYAISMAQSHGSATTGVNAAMLATTGLLVLSSLACVISNLLSKNRQPQFS